MIRICNIDTREQTSEVFTKPLNESLFIYQQRKLSGWKKLCFDTIESQNSDIKHKLKT